MGVHREFSFEDDIELLNLKYQMNNGVFADYFGNATVEPVEKGNIINNREQPKEKL